MSLTVEIDTDHATFVVDPPYGSRVVFEVRLRDITIDCRYTRTRLNDRYVVGLKGSNGNGFSQHLSFERACAAALSRARRYDRAYSIARCAA